MYNVPKQGNFTGEIEKFAFKEQKTMKFFTVKIRRMLTSRADRCGNIAV